MEENKFRSVLAGVILGVFFGILYYIVPTKFLISGTIPVDGLFLPVGIQTAILLTSIKWGGIVGAIVGFFGGLATPITMPRGHMARCVSCTTYLFSTITAFIHHGSQLSHMSAWKIAVTFLMVLVMLIIAIPFADQMSFIEKIRE